MTHDGKDMGQAGDPRETKVLIVDDSAVIRALLARILGHAPGIRVVDTAPDPFVAREKILKHRPDVITLDIEMPRMDGLTFLEKIMRYAPTPVIVFSSLARENSTTALKALELGAVAVLEKPTIRVEDGLRDLRQRLTDLVRGAATTNRKAMVVKRSMAPRAPRTMTGERGALAETSHKVVGIASSTGGTEALKVVLSMLPPDLPATVIVQHMPPAFVRPFAERLNEHAPFEVREARHGDRLLPGLALLAPGDRHMEVERRGAHYFVKLHDEPRLHGVRPAADYLLKSMAHWVGANAVGVVLTGMGKDGAEGLKAMRDAGSFNIAQDEGTSVVFGMPKAAIEAGAVDLTLPLDDIGHGIINAITGRWKHVRKQSGVG